jgi:hypothetical protein
MAEKAKAEKPPAQEVSVDMGDLLEACDSANAWASQLRERAVWQSAEFLTSMEAADRIDAACGRLRKRMMV